MALFVVHLLPEIQEQILIRLSVRDVIRCTSDPSFIKSHLKHSYLSDHSNDEMGDTRLVISNCPGFIKDYLHDIDNRLIEINHRFILGSVNGLSCILPFRKRQIRKRWETSTIKSPKMQ
ncbi:F-box domain, cyclin-like protein [Artemisia annua]|uniref:F-box domain, cyclin-like protein n=1 Tax=Artemisia annua TaxID=35608 RepID=A0A2U1P014_ARTAN|nr:F-box domain, cyclin-like protein [Artemisia annua]